VSCRRKTGDQQRRRVGGVKDRPVLFLTVGDPAGIGPEIVVKALAELERSGLVRLVVVGDRRILDRAASWTGQVVRWREFSDCRSESFTDSVELIDMANANLSWCKPGKFDARCGAAAYEYIEEAVRRCLAGEGAGLVTAPINKAALNAAGYNFAGHTEILAHLCGTRSVAMMLSASGLYVTHVSTHCSLTEAIRRVRPERIEEVVGLTVEALGWLGISKPRVAVAGLNPHAGERGLFGQEEELYIRPAVHRLSARGIEVVGPESPDTVFLRAHRGEFDAVIAMYHDQGHIPVKMLGFRQGVNVTLGLPIVRTSVDHGTAFNIAGTGTADPESMKAAIRMAVAMVHGRECRDP